MKSFIRINAIALFLSFLFAAHLSFGQKLPNIQDRKDTHPKLESVLHEVSLRHRLRGPADAANFAARSNISVKNDQVQVILETLDGNVSAVEPVIRLLGGNPETRYGNLFQASVPLSALESVASINNVKFVRRPLVAAPTVTSEGVAKIEADKWQFAGYRGNGVKVAIVDLGFQGYSSRLGTELPSAVVVRSFRADGDITGGGEPHGSACAETVHDVAPDASLFLVNFSTDVELGNAVDWLITQGVKVISFSIGFLNTAGPGDGTGTVGNIIAKARSNGILWVASAGNFAQTHWLGNWYNPDGDNWHNFALPNDEAQSFTATAGEKITIGLRWNDPWGASANDYDLYLWDNTLNSDGTLVNILAFSTNPQFGFQDPTETIVFTAPYTGTYNIAIRRYCGFKCPDPVEFDLMTFRQPLEYQVPARSLAIGADSPDALTVGASNVSTDVLEYFSSRGPTTDARIKPDLSGPDGTTNSVYGAFFGTSAAAPHVAGSAALVLSAFPIFTTDNIQTFLDMNADDLGVPGEDNLYGYGRVDLGNPVIPLVLSARKLSAGEVGVAYSAPLLTGGRPPYSFTLAKRSAFPPGLTGNSATGRLTGTPTSTKSKGFTVQIVDALGSWVAGAFSIKIVSAVNITTKSLKAATHGKPYNIKLKAKGGAAPYSWSLGNGTTLPAGLTLDSSTGAITGTPALVGTFDLMIRLTDPLGGVDQQNLTLTIK
jgi:subtilisin family serine protease